MQNTPAVQSQIPAIRIFPQPIRNDSSLRDLVRVCVEQRNQAQTYGSPVGAALETFDGVIFGGHNISTGKSKHAEEVSIDSAQPENYRNTDFKRIGVLFQDIHFQTSETFPACPWDWPVMFDETHRYLQIIVLDENCNVKPIPVLEWSKNGLVYEFKESVYLTNIPAIAPWSIWPSNLSRANMKKSNQRPKLPLAPELLEIRGKDPYFDEYCTKVAGFEPLAQEPALAQA